MMGDKKEKVKVLIADDEENTRRLLEEYIAGMGHEVDVASDGKETLRHLDSKDYDLVFLDCNMPEATGIEVARCIKDKRRRPKIIMMTGYDPMDEAFAKAAGVDVYLRKPLLLDKVKEVVQGGR